jgi:NADH-quinone oxidoreductase subunit F
VGTKWVTQILQKIEDGRGSQADLDLLLSVCDRIMGKCLCPLGDSDAIAVLSYVDRFRDEYQAHIDLGRCPFDGESSLERILAPSEMHERHGHEAAHV